MSGRQRDFNPLPSRRTGVVNADPFGVLFFRPNKIRFGARASRPQPWVLIPKIVSLKLQVSVAGNAAPSDAEKWEVTRFS
jgi:hypothetical protein